MSNQKKYCIYIHKNKINNKVYVGQTSNKPQYRWNKGEGYKTSTLFYNAIQKYGWDNFQHIVLYTDLSLEEANSLEQYLIKRLKSDDRDFGYNILDGGTNYHHTEEQKQKQSAFMKKQWENQEYRQSQSERMKKKWEDQEYRQNIIEKISGTNSHFYGSNKSGQNNPMYGRHHTQESKKKMSQSQKKYAQTHPDAKKGKNNPAARAVQCIQTGEIFDTCKQAAEWSHISTSSMNRNLHGQQKFAGTHPVYGFKVSFKYIDNKEK